MKKNIKNKIFLITGGSGFVGSHVCDFVIKNGGRVVCVDNFVTGKKEHIDHLVGNKNFKLYRANVNRVKEIAPIFRKTRPDYVMHYASLVGVKRTVQRPLDVFDDFHGTLNIADLSRTYGVKRIFYSSSSEVYGEPRSLPIKESEPYNAQLPYGIVKVMTESYLMEFSKKYNIPVTVARFFNVYGPRQDFGESGFVVSLFIKNALSGKPLEIFGDGSQTRDFVYVDDNIRLCMKAFFNKNVNCKPINIGSGKSIKIITLAKTIQKIVPGAKIVYKPMRTMGEIVYRQPAVSFMKKVLSDRPEVQLSEGLRKTIDYFGAK